MVLTLKREGEATQPRNADSLSKLEKGRKWILHEPLEGTQLYCCLFFFPFFMAASRSLWDLRSLTRSQTWAPDSESLES